MATTNNSSGHVAASLNPVLNHLYELFLSTVSLLPFMSSPTTSSTSPPTIISAPGKVLLAGGYLVLDPLYSGIVVSTSSRFYAIVRENSAAGRPHQILVRSPQFLDATWAYDALYSHRGEVGIRPSVSNASKNKFVQLAIERVLFLAIETNGSQALKQITGQGIEIIIVGDNDFYSQRGQLAALNLPSALASLAQIPRFAPTNCSLADVHKTGLGSSAALITSLVAALMIHLAVLPPTTLGSSSATSTDNEEARSFIHGTAQYVHCLAQGKVGSGFDVSSATYGSQLYRRFSPEVIQPLMMDGAPARLLPYLSPKHNKSWNHVIKPFKLPPLTRLMLADVDAGTDTPAAVGKVLSWKKQNPDKAKELWTSLGALNDTLAQAFLGLSTLHQKNPGAYQTAVTKLIGYSPDKWASLDAKDEVIQAYASVHNYTEAIRSKMREMGTQSQVPIEPPEQTHLLDGCIAKPGVVGGGVPGAGGYDAIWVLVIDLGSTATSRTQTPTAAVESVWSGWKEMNVSPLSCTESAERGARSEGGEVMDWLRKANYV